MGGKTLFCHTWSQIKVLALCKFVIIIFIYIDYIVWANIYVIAQINLIAQITLICKYWAMSLLVFCASPGVSAVTFVS